MASDSAPVASFKDWFNPVRYRAIADRLQSACPEFDRRRFLKLTLDDLESRELMARLRQTAHAAHAALPDSFADQLAVLRKAAEGEAQSFVGIWYSEFVGIYGLDTPEISLPALRHFTRYGSAEWAVRGFILRDPKATLAEMLRWTEDGNEHVRRLASEGSRPRLPWGTRLGFLVDDPSPTLPILEKLKADPALYVRKSVANHLNDIAKDHGDLVVALAGGWDRGDARTAWIVRHGLRTLIKRGHRGALTLLGAGQEPAVRIDRFHAVPAKLTIGETARIEATITSTAKTAQTLIVDFVVHYVKANGSTSPKAFKWKQLNLASGAGITLAKALALRDLSTRRHFPGHHRIALQINGRTVAETVFVLARKRG